jgi:S-disulfanyl-L-cysteine oxidoreductase SoxD
MRCFPKLPLTMMVAAVNIACLAALAQTPDYTNVGQTPTPEDIKAWDIAIGPEGKELPPGSGSAKDGAPIFARKCAVCHGPDLKGGWLITNQIPRAALVGGKGTLATLHPVLTIGSWWPYATTLWDYINRAMPRGQEGSLKADEVYALSAFLLYKNDIIQESDVLDAKSLPKVQMPARDIFRPVRIEDITNYKKRGCRLGHCPN